MMASSIRSKLDIDFCLVSREDDSPVKSNIGFKMSCVGTVDAWSLVEVAVASVTEVLLLLRMR